MGWVNFDPLFRLGLYPTAWNLTTGKNECVRLAFVDDGEFEVAIKGRGGYRLPHWALYTPLRQMAF
jgi:hypothetical protein